MIRQYIIRKDILIVYHLIGATLRTMCQVGSHTQRVIVRQLPIYTSRIGQAIVFPRHRIGTILTEYLIFCFHNLFECAVLPIILVESINGSKHIDTILAIIDIESALWTIKIVAQVVLIGQCQSKTEPLSLLLTGTDSNHSPHLGVIFCTGVIDYLHIANILAAQSLQLVAVAHQSPVDIYKRCSFA